MPVRLTESYLRKIIREEVSRLLNEEQRMSFEDAFEAKYGYEEPLGHAGFIARYADMKQKAKQLYDSGVSLDDAIRQTVEAEINKFKK